MERHDRQTTPAHGASDGQNRDMAPSLLTSTVSRGTRMEKKDTAILKAFGYLSFFSFPLL